MHDGKDGHFDAEEHAGDANLDVLRSDSLAGRDGAGRCEKRDEEL